jgi:hypothetical protein
MKKTLISMLGASALAAFVATGCAPPDYVGCDTIPDGTISTEDGNTVTAGFDSYGYDYQNHQFASSDYCDYYRGDVVLLQDCIDAGWEDTYLEMHWNKKWLANVDCDGDGRLDRHSGNSDYIGSEAELWQRHAGYDEHGAEWGYFSVIKAKPTADFDCESVGEVELSIGDLDIWFGGEEVWGQFCKRKTIEYNP